MGIKDKLTEAELRAAYESRKTEFQERSELPTDLFAGQPELTPPIIRPFEDVRTQLAVALAEEKAQAEISDKFSKIKDEVLFPYYEEYAAALEEIDEAKKLGTNPKKELPAADRPERAGRARRLELRNDPVALPRASGPVRPDRGGGGRHSRLSGGRKFADEFFDPKKSLYEPEELTDLLGTRFLARKIKDVPPHVPALDEVRPDVSLAWKMGKARPLAEKAAQDLAEKLKKKARRAQGRDGRRFSRRDDSRDRAPRNQLPAPADTSPAHPRKPRSRTFPIAGESFRKAYFDLQPGTVAVATNQPRTIYYVMVPERREPATFAALYAPNGDELPPQDVGRPTGGPGAPGALDGLAPKASGPGKRLGSSRRGQGQVVVRRRCLTHGDWTTNLEVEDCSALRSRRARLPQRLSQDDQGDPGDRPGHHENDRRPYGSTRAWPRALAVDLGPNTRRTNATANGTSPNKTMSPSLNSGKRARMTNKPSTIQ